jgi:hypothetical protein
VGEKPTIIELHRKKQMKQPDWADRSWLLKTTPFKAADSRVKTLTAIMLTLIAAALIKVI